MTEERKLIEQIVAGDHDAFELLVKKYEDRVYHLCLRMCADPEQAKDLAQEAFIKAWRGLRFYKHEAAFSTWLYRLTGNVCIDYLRSKKRSAAMSLTVDEEDGAVLDVEDPAPTPEQQTLENDTKQAIAAAMNRLEEDFRMVLVLRVVEQRSYEEIAEIMDLKPGTVKSRLARAREKLRKILLESGNDFGMASVKKRKEEGDA